MEQLPDINCTDQGWAWITEDEIHILTAFGAVHVTKLHGVCECSCCEHLVRSEN